MIKWTRINYPNYCTRGLVALTEEQMADTPKYYKCTHDFKYDVLNVDILKAFISSGKVKEIKDDGTKIFYSFDHLQKYKDAVLYGARRQKVKLGDIFTGQIDAFMESSKRRIKKRKKWSCVLRKKPTI